MIKKIFKMIGIASGSILALSLILGIAFVGFSPQFGSKPNKEQLAYFNTLSNYKDGKFENLIETKMDMSFSNMVKISRQFLKKDNNRAPQKPFFITKLDSSSIVDKTPQITRLTWFGHSAFLLEINGLNVLLDPMLGETPSPHPLFGTKRFYKELPIEIEKMPVIDLVLISHDHYDHLDMGSIQKLKQKVKKFYVPLGVGAHLISWGVEPSQVVELNWWQESKYEGLELAFTPSRHFSGRGIGDRNETLWGSWVVKSKLKSIYFSGDGGYGPHFKEIGNKYGPFDFALIECGQYNQNWASIHMMPEESVKAALDIKASKAMPIHWGAFTLALHNWKEPVTRFKAEAAIKQLEIATPQIGETVIIDSVITTQNSWWENY